MTPLPRWSAAAVAVSVLLFAGARAQTPRAPSTAFMVPLSGYRLIGRVPVRANEGRETFAFDRPAHTYTAAAIRVRSAELDIFEVLFTFIDGTTFAPVGVLFFREGAMTRELAQAELVRPIRTLSLRYRNSAGRLGDIEVWGR
jgi:hypothetical protein